MKLIVDKMPKIASECMFCEKKISLICRIDGKPCDGSENPSIWFTSCRCLKEYNYAE